MTKSRSSKTKQPKVNKGDDDSDDEKLPDMSKIATEFDDLDAVFKLQEALKKGTLGPLKHKYGTSEVLPSPEVLSSPVVLPSPKHSPKKTNTTKKNLLTAFYISIGVAAAMAAGAFIQNNPGFNYSSMSNNDFPKIDNDMEKLARYLDERNFKPVKNGGKRTRKNQCKK